MIRWGKTRRSFSSRRVGKSGAVDPSTGYALYLPFSAASPTYRSGLTTGNSITAMPGYAYTRSGAKQELLASAGGVSAVFAANVPGIVSGVGYYSRGAFTNLLLNAGQSSNLVTQNVTVTAQAYTLSFLGTGTVTLSGVSVAGPLVGTGANNQVSLTFTPTAGTLTLTVTGNVAYSNLVTGSGVGPIIATAGATASTGADALLASTFTALADTDMVLFAKVNCAALFSVGGLVEFSDGSATNYAVVYISTTNWAYEIKAAGAVLSLGANSVGATTATDTIVLFHRLAGKWRFGRVVAGAIVWANAATTGAMPTLTNARFGYGPNTGVNPLNGVVLNGGTKLGTFTTDADVIAAVSI